MRTLIILILVIVCNNIVAQPVEQRLLKAWNVFINDPQMKHGIAGFSVADSKTGKVIFERNAQIGLAPASVQKIITSVAAYELLGKNYQYKTIFRTKESGSFFIMEVIGSGDPTLGSWRFGNENDSTLLAELQQSYRKKYKDKIYDSIILLDDQFGNPLPGGFTWEDMGNYYGAGSRQFNWRENQYDLYFSSTSAGPAALTSVIPMQDHIEFRNTVMADASVKGDEIIVYGAPGSSIVYLDGRMPVNKKNFEVVG